MGRFGKYSEFCNGREVCKVIGVGRQLHWVLFTVARRLGSGETGSKLLGRRGVNADTWCGSHQLFFIASGWQMEPTTKGPHINSTTKGCGLRLGGFYCSEAPGNWQDRKRKTWEGGASGPTQGAVETSCFPPQTTDKWSPPRRAHTETPQQRVATHERHF
jgi:hypothetical protein